MTASEPPFRRVLIANRGEIALRVIHTAKELGVETVAVFSDADRNALHVRRADHAVHIGASKPAQSYLAIDKIIAAARATDSDCVHPGYGFLAENAAFARACVDAGLTFLGPSAEAIEQMGDKVVARRVAVEANVPLVPGLSDDVRDDDVLREKALEIGYPVMLKAAAGGGGKGIRIVHAESELLSAAEMARAEARSAFGDDRVYLEKFVTEPRHVEVQIVGDQDGNVVAWGERECSVQRRHQKLVEESPCSVLTPEMRAAMEAAACRLAKAASYVGAGTVEFLYSRGEFYFLEMNTRLQVEHPITEARFGIDLVREQFRVAKGLPATPATEPRGHAIEVRINAEDPETFYPSLGTVRRMSVPGGAGVRLDSCLYRGLTVTPFYDSMLAKLIVHADDRAAAIARIVRALRELRLVGITTSASVALRAIESEPFRSGNYDTSILDTIDRSPSEHVVELASLAAAVAKFLGTERVDADDDAPAAESAASMWTMLDRVARLGRVPR